jgi:hypothetical protein
VWDNGKATVEPTHVEWTGDSPGASASNSAVDGVAGHGPHTGATGGGGIGGAGGGGIGGAGGGGHGGAGGGRNNSGSDPTKHNLKMSFPHFDGENPRIWRDKCLDYFWLFNVHPSLWFVSTTLHMDGNAALWLKAYKLRYEISGWPVLMTAIEEKFGADDSRRFMKQFLALKQTGTVKEYQVQFETLSYQLSLQNPHYDEQFYVAQFIKGLKQEIRGTVES